MRYLVICTALLLSACATCVERDWSAVALKDRPKGWARPCSASISAQGYNDMMLNYHLQGIEMRLGR